MESIDSNTKTKKRRIIPSPVRSVGRIDSTESVTTDGLIDLQELNYILRNPELPKSRLKINSILKEYNEEKCRAITLSRINHKFTNRNQISSQFISNDDKEANLDRMAEYEVQLSQLPQELLVNILGETFAKYQNEINRRNNETTDASDSDQLVDKSNGIGVKKEILSDNESYSEPELQIVNDNNNNNLNDVKEHLQKLINDYESVEKEEKSVSSTLQMISKELETKLELLRETIAVCDMFKEQNEVYCEKQNRLLTKKIKLKNKMKKANEKLSQLIRNSQNNSQSDKYLSTALTCFQNDKNTASHSSVQKKKKKIKDNQNISHIKRKSLKTSQCINPSTVKSGDNSNSSLKTKKSSKKNDSIVKNKIFCETKKLTEDSLQPIDIIAVDTDSDDVMFIENDSMEEMSEKINDIKKEANNRKKQTIKISNERTDWKDDYVNLVLNPVSDQQPKTSTPLLKQNPLQKPSNSNQWPKLSLDMKTPNRSDNAETAERNNVSNDRNRFRTGSSAAKTLNQTNKMTTTITNSTYEKSVHLNNNKSIKTHSATNGKKANFTNPSGEIISIVNSFDCSIPPEFSPHVSALFIEQNKLFIGFYCGYITQYLIGENDTLEYSHQYPNLESYVTALYYSVKYNIVYCGTRTGLFAYFKADTGYLNVNYETIIFKTGVMCFESSATILYIGLRDGSVQRFGFMSNKIINSFRDSNDQIVGLKLINNATDQNRIIVCCKTHISIRNSTDGSLLQTIDKPEYQCDFFNFGLDSNKILIYANLSHKHCHISFSYDENQRTYSKICTYSSRIRLMTSNCNNFYIYTELRDLSCYDRNTSVIKWKTHVETKPANSMVVQNKKVILGLPFGGVIILNIDEKDVIICQFRKCGNKFYRKCDIYRHFRFDHARPMCNMTMPFVHCPWFGCNLKITKIEDAIVEHLKHHI